MTMTNEQSKKDLIGYAKITLWSTFFLTTILILGMVLAYVFDRLGLMNFFLGGLIGAILAIGNLFAIGYAFYRLVIIKEKRWALLIPMATFLTMCVFAFGLAVFWTALMFGFAVGLVTPVLIGAILVYMTTKPA